MSLRIPRPLRAACAALALAAYASPMVVGLAAHAGHGLEHVLEVIGDLERKAAAMGVAHLHDAPSGRDRGTFVHQHGDAPHAHDAAVGVLLVAAEESDEHADEAGVTAPIELSSHVPAGGVLTLLAAGRAVSPTAEPSAAGPRNLLPPPLPPPRA